MTGISRPLARALAPTAALLPLLTLASCGSDGAGSAPRFVVATHGHAEFLHAANYCPDHMDFSVFLESGGRGWVSLEHEAFGSKVVEGTWTEEGGRFRITVPEVRVSGLFQEDPYYSAEVGWEDLSLEVRDDDRDGIAETGTATATLICDYEELLFPYTDTWDSTFGLEVDPQPTSLAFGRDLGLEPIYTFRDAMTVHASRPILAENLPGQIGMLVDGQPVSASVIASGVVGPFADGFTIDPQQALPFDASVTLDGGGLADAFGRAVAFDGVAVQTISDPGPLTVNPGFEGEGGWIGLHRASGGDSFPAIDGQSIATVSYDYPRGDDLIGYFDVPMDATEFSLWVGDYDYLVDCSHGRSRLYLEVDGSVLGLSPDVPDSPDCTDFPYGCTIPWQKKTVSLVEMRGKRAVVRASPAKYTECRPDVTDELVVDGVRVE